jgi:RNA recognition motif-containing protein
LKLTNDFCHSAYITYKDEVSASLAIAGLDKFTYKGKRLEASYGTNKFCRFYLNNQPCRNKNCNFIHYEVKKSDCFVKHQELENKTIFESKAFLV